jgi:hypothetical protein
MIATKARIPAAPIFPKIVAVIITYFPSTSGGELIGKKSIGNKLPQSYWREAL